VNNEDGVEALNVYNNNEYLGQVDAGGSARFTIPAGRVSVGVQPIGGGSVMDVGSFSAQAGVPYTIRLARTSPG
jgi:hypothetical protein